MRSRSDRRKAAPAPASRAMMILAPPSLLGLRGRTRFFLLLLLLSPLEEDLGKLKSPVLPFVPFSTSDIFVLLVGIALLYLYSPSCWLVKGCGQGIVGE